jgi:hypothetical protein
VVNYTHRQQAAAGQVMCFQAISAFVFCPFSVLLLFCPGWLPCQRAASMLLAPSCAHTMVGPAGQGLLCVFTCTTPSAQWQQQAPVSSNRSS